MWESEGRVGLLCFNFGTNCLAWFSVIVVSLLHSLPVLGRGLLPWQLLRYFNSFHYIIISVFYYVCIGVCIDCVMSIHTTDTLLLLCFCIWGFYVLLWNLFSIMSAQLSVELNRKGLAAFRWRRRSPCSSASIILWWSMVTFFSITTHLWLV